MDGLGLESYQCNLMIIKMSDNQDHTKIKKYEADKGSYIIQLVHQKLNCVDV